MGFNDKLQRRFEMNPNRNQGSIWKSILLFISVFVIIVALLLYYSNSSTTMKEFQPEGYYIVEYSDKGADEKAIYESLISNTKAYTCPSVSLAKSSEGVIHFGYGNPNGVFCWVLSNKVCSAESDSTNVTLIAPYWDLADYNRKNPNDTRNDVLGISDICKIDTLMEEGSGKKPAGTPNEAIMLNPSNNPYKYVEIIAPFDFKFLNNNTDSGDKIIITNSTGNYKITFSNTSNWFCAGKPPEEELESVDYATDISVWIAHKTDHRNIFGSSANSKISSGTKGSVIGYANDKTTMLVEEYDGTTWKAITIKNWLGF